MLVYLYMYSTYITIYYISITDSFIFYSKHNYKFVFNYIGEVNEKGR